MWLFHCVVATVNEASSNECLLLTRKERQIHTKQHGSILVLKCTGTPYLVISVTWNFVCADKKRIVKTTTKMCVKREHIPVARTVLWYQSVNQGSVSLAIFRLMNKNNAFSSLALPVLCQQDPQHDT
jgi:hypothetical protein